MAGNFQTVFVLVLALFWGCHTDSEMPTKPTTISATNNLDGRPIIESLRILKEENEEKPKGNGTINNPLNEKNKTKIENPSYNIPAKLESRNSLLDNNKPPTKDSQHFNTQEQNINNERKVNNETTEINRQLNLKEDENKTDVNVTVNRGISVDVIKESTLKSSETNHDSVVTQKSNPDNGTQINNETTNTQNNPKSSNKETNSRSADATEKPPNQAKRFRSSTKYTRKSSSRPTSRKNRRTKPIRRPETVTKLIPDDELTTKATVYRKRVKAFSFSSNDSHHFPHYYNHDLNNTETDYDGDINHEINVNNSEISKTVSHYNLASHQHHHHHHHRGSHHKLSAEKNDTDASIVEIKDRDSETHHKSHHSNNQHIPRPTAHHSSSSHDLNTEESTTTKPKEERRYNRFHLNRNYTYGRPHQLHKNISESNGNNTSLVSHSNAESLNVESGGSSGLHHRFRYHQKTSVDRKPIKNETITEQADVSNTTDSKAIADSIPNTYQRFRKNRPHWKPVTESRINNNTEEHKGTHNTTESNKDKVVPSSSSFYEKFRNIRPSRFKRPLTHSQENLEAQKEKPLESNVHTEEHKETNNTTESNKDKVVPSSSSFYEKFRNIRPNRFKRPLTHSEENHEAQKEKPLESNVHEVETNTNDTNKHNTTVSSNTRYAFKKYRPIHMKPKSQQINETKHQEETTVEKQEDQVKTNDNESSTNNIKIIQSRYQPDLNTKRKHQINDLVNHERQDSNKNQTEDNSDQNVPTTTTRAYQRYGKNYPNRVHMRPKTPPFKEINTNDTTTEVSSSTSIYERFRPKRPHMHVTSKPELEQKEPALEDNSTTTEIPGTTNIYNRFRQRIYFNKHKNSSVSDLNNAHKDIREEISTEKPHNNPIHFPHDDDDEDEEEKINVYQNYGAHKRLNMRSSSNDFSKNSDVDVANGGAVRETTRTGENSEGNLAAALDLESRNVKFDDYGGTQFLKRRSRDNNSHNTSLGDESDVIKKESNDRISPDQKDLFSADENDESLFENINPDDREDSFFDLEGFEFNSTENPLEKVTIILPKSFTIEDYENKNTTNLEDTAPTGLANPEELAHMQKYIDSRTDVLLTEFVTVDPQHLYGRTNEKGNIKEDKINTEKPLVPVDIFHRNPMHFPDEDVYDEETTITYSTISSVNPTTTNESSTTIKTTTSEVDRSNHTKNNTEIISTNTDNIKQQVVHEVKKFLNKIGSNQEIVTNHSEITNNPVLKEFTVIDKVNDNSTKNHQRTGLLTQNNTADGEVNKNTNLSDDKTTKNINQNNTSEKPIETSEAPIKTIIDDEEGVGDGKQKSDDKSTERSSENMFVDEKSTVGYKIDNTEDTTDKNKVTKDTNITEKDEKSTVGYKIDNTEDTTDKNKVTEDTNITEKDVNKNNEQKSDSVASDDKEVETSTENTFIGDKTHIVTVTAVDHFEETTDQNIVTMEYNTTEKEIIKNSDQKSDPFASDNKTKSTENVFVGEKSTVVFKVDGDGGNDDDDDDDDDDNNFDEITESTSSAIETTLSFTEKEIVTQKSDLDVKPQQNITENKNVTKEGYPKIFSSNIFKIPPRFNHTNKNRIQKPIIYGKLLGNTVKFSVELKILNETIYIPSNAKIMEDLDKKTLNFTWTINNLSKFMMSLNLTKNVSKYEINGVQLQLVKDGNMSVWMKNVTNHLKSNEIEKVLPLDLGHDVKIVFYNTGFLKITDDENNIKDAKSAASEDSREIRIFHVEIALGILIGVCILTLILYIVIKKLRIRSIKKNNKVPTS